MGWFKKIFSKKIPDVPVLLTEVMSIYPDDCASPRRRTEYLYKIQENLRQLHNTFVTWRDEGIPEGVWAGFPEPIRKTYRYRFQIDMQTWQKFHDEDFMPRSEKIGEEICIQRKAFKEDAVRDIFNAKGEINIGEI